MISWILTTRNDQYGGQVEGVINATMKRLRITVESISRLKGEHEIVVVDFGSIGTVSNFLTDYNVKNVWIHPDAVDALIDENDDKNMSFYEYVAKDIGIMHSEGNNIIICNPDNIFPERDFEFVEQALDMGYIVRAKRYEIDRDILLENINEIVDRGETGEFKVIGEFLGAAGDFTAIKRKHYDELGGYLMVHGNWHLDNELLERALQKGMKIANVYKHYHINHDDAIDSPLKNKDWKNFKPISKQTLRRVYELAQIQDTCTIA